MDMDVHRMISNGISHNHTILHNVQANKVKALEKVDKAFTKSDLNEILQIQNQLKIKTEELQMKP